MVKNHKLARTISDAGWNKLINMINGIAKQYYK